MLDRVGTEHADTGQIQRDANRNVAAGVALALVGMALLNTSYTFAAAAMAIVGIAIAVRNVSTHARQPLLPPAFEETDVRPDVVALAMRMTVLPGARVVAAAPLARALFEQGSLDELASLLREIDLSLSLVAQSGDDELSVPAQRLRALAVLTHALQDARAPSERSILTDGARATDRLVLARLSLAEAIRALREKQPAEVSEHLDVTRRALLDMSPKEQLLWRTVLAAHRRPAATDGYRASSTPQRGGEAQRWIAKVFAEGESFVDEPETEPIATIEIEPVPYSLGQELSDPPARGRNALRSWIEVFAAIAIVFAMALVVRHPSALIAIVAAFLLAPAYLIARSSQAMLQLHGFVIARRRWLREPFATAETMRALSEGGVAKVAVRASDELTTHEEHQGELARAYESNERALAAARRDSMHSSAARRARLRRPLLLLAIERREDAKRAIIDACRACDSATHATVLRWSFALRLALRDRDEARVLELAQRCPPLSRIDSTTALLRDAALSLRDAATLSHMRDRLEEWPEARRYVAAWAPWLVERIVARGEASSDAREDERDTEDASETELEQRER